MRWPSNLASSRVFHLSLSRSLLRSLYAESPASNGSHAKDVTANKSVSSALLQGLDPESFFNHTSGRWLWDEKHQLARRRLKFNITELGYAAAQATGSQSCIKIEKLSEGSFNKVFLLTMHNGKELVAKLPNPNAGRSHFVTASEVATMDYVRNALGIPAPRVYSWNSSSENPVEAEYILMEKCQGKELRLVWDDMTDRQKASIIQKLVGFENAFASSAFPTYGSLYYASDLQSATSNRPRNWESEKAGGSHHFVVGPTTDRDFFDHGRYSVDTDRGPWSSIEEYTLARVHRELACLDQSSIFPNQQGFFYGPGQYKPNTETKRRILQNFLRVARYLKPKDPLLSRGVLWHIDLHSDNIFVDSADPTNITAIIDWQAVHISPLFAQARHPTFLEFEGAIPETYDSKAITLPEDYESLSPEDQMAARKLRSAQKLWKFYELELACRCDDIRRATRFGEGPLGKLSTFAGNVFSDGELLVEDLLIQLQEQWDKMVEDPLAESCPLSFSPADKAAHEEQFELWGAGVVLMTDFLQKIGGYRGWDGWVKHEQYEAGKAAMDRLREEFLERHAATENERREWIKAWPFSNTQ